MKIAYVENIRLPTERAHGIQIMKMCEAWGLSGHTVKLFVSGRKSDLTSNPFSYYGVKEVFSISRIYVPNIICLGRFGFFIQTLIFSEIASWSISRFQPTVVFSRDEKILFNYILRFKNLVWESHRGSWNFFTKIIVRYVKKIIVISNGLREFYCKKEAKLDQKIIISRDAVDVGLFRIENCTKEECRIKLGLPLNKKIALYSGHLYLWKGVYTLSLASVKMNDDEMAIFVGGMDYDVQKFKDFNKENKHLIVLGQKPYSLIPFYLKSADVLILPNSNKESLGSTFTSPLKLFEYMASGVPIVASKVKAICEILNESNSTLFEPDDPEALLLAIRKVFAGGKTIDDKTFRASDDVKKYTWQQRAKSIVDSLSNLS